MAHYTYGPFTLPYEDSVATIFEDATGAAATLYDDNENVVADPTYNGNQLYFRAEEGTYDVIVTHADGSGRTFTRVELPGPELQMFSSPASFNRGRDTFIYVVDAGADLSKPRPVNAGVVYWMFSAGTDVGTEGANVVNRVTGDIVFVAT